MIDFYKKLDTKLLKKTPFHWILGWHLFLPIIAILSLFGAVLGYLLPTKQFTYSDDGLGITSFFIGFVSFMAFILYVIRQVRFNSFRIHHRIPFNKSVLVFFSFWLLTTLFSLVPFIPYQVHSWHVVNKVNEITNDFEKDTETLYKGSAFFEATYVNKEDLETLSSILNDTIIYEKDKQFILREFPVFFKDDKVSISKVIHSFGYNQYRYSNNDKKRVFPKTISKEEALTYITKFITVAEKYDIRLKERNPQEIYNKRKAQINEGNSYSLLVLENKTYTAGRSYDRMMDNYNRHLKNDIDTDIIVGLLIFSILISLLLWVFVMVSKAEFGYSILASVLIMILMGVFSAILAFSSIDDFGIRFLFYVAIIVVYSIAFIGENTRLKQVFKIVSHYVVVVFAFLIFLEIENLNLLSNREEFVLFGLLLISSVIISVFVFKKVYANNRLLPK